jgi:OOP family OmpA-OmpF porin
MIRNVSQFALLAVAVILFAASPAAAEVRINAFTLSPMIGYQTFDSETDLKDSPVYGLAMGYTTSANWALEFDLRYAPSEIDKSDGPDVKVWTATANVLYHFMPEQAFVPYLVGGIGGLQYNSDESNHDDEDFIANWGGGFKYSIADNIDLRMDLRHVIDFRTDNEARGQSGSDVVNNFSASFGLNFQFGGASHVPVRVSR